MEVIDLGLLSYLEAEEVQLKKVAEVIGGQAPSTLFFCSHPPSVTCGRSTQPEDLRGWTGPSFKTSRGGRATYHGPSQMVVYPILDLAKSYPGLRTKDLHHYLKFLSEVTSAVLQEMFGLQSQAAPAEPEKFTTSGKLHFTGVWTGNLKLASIGIAVKNWVSYHGIALNLYEDANAFQGIVPCGFSQDTMASLEFVLGEKVSREELQSKWALEFARRLGEGAS